MKIILTVFCTMFMWGVPIEARESESVYTVIFHEDVPAWIRRDFQAGLQSSLAHYEGMFGAVVRGQIPVHVTYGVDGNMSKGSVSNVDGMTFNLQGTEWENEKNKRAVHQLQEFIWHESFHIWHVYHYPKLDRGVNAFLHEGAADYFTWSEQQGRKNEHVTVENWLNGCASSLGQQSLIDVANNPTAKANYLCGPFIHWLVDSWLRDLGGQDTVATVWRDLFAATKQQNFKPQMLLDRLFVKLNEVTGDDSRTNILREFIYGSGMGRWTHFSEHLINFKLGLRLKRLEEHGSNQLIELMLRSLITDECGNSTTWKWTRWGVSSLTIGGCETLKKLNGIQTINGVKIPDDAYEAFLLIRRACQRDSKVKLGKSFWKKDMTLQCQKNVMEPPVSFVFD